MAIDGTNHLWQLAVVDNACTIYGFVVVDSAGTHLLYAEELSEPVGLNDLLAGLVYVPQFALGGPDWGNGEPIM